MPLAVRDHLNLPAGSVAQSRREPISVAEVAFALERRASIRASWQAVAQMLNRHVDDLRLACEAHQSLQVAATPAAAGPVAPAPKPPKPPAQQFPPARHGSFDHRLLQTLVDCERLSRQELAERLGNARRQVDARTPYLALSGRLKSHGTRGYLYSLTAHGRAELARLKQAGARA